MNMYKSYRAALLHPVTVTPLDDIMTELDKVMALTAELPAAYTSLMVYIYCNYTHVAMLIPL